MKLRAASLLLLFALLCSCTSRQGNSHKLYSGSALCGIAPDVTNIFALELQDSLNSYHRNAIVDTVFSGIPARKLRYAFDNPKIFFDVIYPESYAFISFLIEGELFTHTAEAPYLSLYKDEGYLSSLYWLAFTNYYLTTNQRSYLVCRTYPAENPVRALHNLYFIFDITDKKTFNFIPLATTDIATTALAISTRMATWTS